MINRCEEHNWSDSSGWGVGDEPPQHCPDCAARSIQQHFEREQRRVEQHEARLVAPFKKQITDMESEIAELKCQLAFVTDVLKGLQEELHGI